MNEFDSMIQSYSFSLFASLIRMLAGRYTDKYGGYILIQIGIILIIIGSSILTFGEGVSGWGPTNLIGLFLLAFGFGLKMIGDLKWILEIQYMNFIII